MPPSLTHSTISHLKTVFLMPILRPTSSEQPTQNTDFQQSVATTPMAMSMMIDSMVNMMQINRPPLDDRTIDPTIRQNDN